ncbi:MAG: hypothetical protein ACI8QS_003635 [Planctomycetota bacterium]|jgi:hypothetical protein
MRAGKHHSLSLPATYAFLLMSPTPLPPLSPWRRLCPLLPLAFALTQLGAILFAGPTSLRLQEDNELERQHAEEFPLEETGPPAPPFAEGPLSNDAFLPQDTAANEAFAEADQYLLEARSSATDQARNRSLGLTFEAWGRVAGRLSLLGGTSLMDGVLAGTSSEGTARLIEGTRAALGRRVAFLSASERERWRELFGDVAAAGDTDQQALAWPGTVAAAEASLRLFDRSMETGRLALASARLASATRLAALLDEHPRAAALRAPLERRAGVLRNWRSALETESAWHSASKLEARGSIQFIDRELPTVASHAPPGHGVRPGIVAPDASTLVVQTATALWRVDLDPSGRPQAPTRESLNRILDPAFGPLPRPRVGREAPGWALSPLLFDGDLFLVHGARAGLQDGTPNALCRLAIPKAGARGTPFGTAGLTPRFGSAADGPRWVLSGDLLWTAGSDPEGQVENLAALAELPELEWQPGILIVDDLLIAQARQISDRTEAWLVGIEPSSGQVRWTRKLGASAGLETGLGRFSVAPVPRVAAPALLERNGLVLAPTQLGFHALVNPADGELLWTMATRRREPTKPGWDLTGPFGSPGYDPLETPLAWIAPADSDRLYGLTLGPLASGPTGGASLPQSGATLALGTAEALLGVSDGNPVVLRRDGRERTVALLRGPGKLPLDAFHLGPQEGFRGRALASDKRILVSTDRAVYLLDRERDLGLLAVTPLERRGNLPGGDVHAIGPWVIVLGFDALWVLSPAP